MCVYVCVFVCIPEPEKSIAPAPRIESLLYADNQPDGDHSQWATTGYTQMVMKKLYIRYEWNVARSAMDPDRMVQDAACDTHGHMHTSLITLSMDVCV